MSKVDNIKRFFPSLYKPFLNTYIKSLLETIGSQDDSASEQIQNAKEQIFVATAIGKYLDVLGSNVGVERPVESTNFYTGDSLYRLIIPIMSFYPKQVRDTMKALLLAIFGNNPEVFIKEISPNKIVVQLPANISVIRDTLLGTTHFREQSGNIAQIDNSAKTIIVNFDNNLNTSIAYLRSLDKITIYNAATSNLALGIGRMYNEGGGIKVDKIGVTSATCGINIDHQYYPLDTTDQKYVSYLVYLSDVTDVVSVAAELHTGGSDSSTWTKTKTEAKLQAGWNLVNFDITQAASSMVGAGVTGSNITKISTLVTFSATGSVLSDIEFSKVYATSTSNLFVADEFAGMKIMSDGEKADIVSHDAGTSNVTLQFGGSEDLTVYSKVDKFQILNSDWPGDFVFYPTGPAYYIREPRATLGQVINTGDPGGAINFLNTSEIPDTTGYLVFNYGKPNEEYLVPYVDVIDSVTLVVDPTYSFTEDHVIGETVNLIGSNAFEPNDEGTDHAIYNTATDALVVIVDDLLNLLKATGVIVRFEVKI